MRSQGECLRGNSGKNHRRLAKKVMKHFLSRRGEKKGGENATGIKKRGKNLTKRGRESKKASRGNPVRKRKGMGGYRGLATTAWLVEGWKFNYCQ